MRKTVVMIFVFAVISLGICLPFDAVAKPMSLDRCFDNASSCWANAAKCIHPQKCRLRCDEKYKQCTRIVLGTGQTKQTNGWTNSLGSGAGVIGVPGSSPVTGVTAIGGAVSSGGAATLSSSSTVSPQSPARIASPTISGSAGAGQIISNGSIVSPQLPPGTTPPTKSGAAGSGQINGLGSGGPTNRKQF